MRIHDFKSFNTIWVKQALDQDFSEYKLKEKSKWEKRAQKYGLRFPLFESFEDFKSKIESSKVINIDDYRDEIHNLTSVDDMDTLRELVSGYQYPRDIDRIIRGLESKSHLPMPIILKGDKGMIIMSGNTRQNVAYIMEIPTQAILIDLSNRILESKEWTIQDGYREIETVFQEVTDEYKILNIQEIPTSELGTLTRGYLEKGDIFNALNFFGRVSGMLRATDPDDTPNLNIAGAYYVYYPPNQWEKGDPFYRMGIKYNTYDIGKGDPEKLDKFKGEVETFFSRMEDEGYKVDFYQCFNGFGYDGWEATLVHKK